MPIEAERFEKEGLKIDQERVLTYSGLICPFGCKYCFSEDLNPEQEKHATYLSEKQFNLLEQLPKEIKLIMLGCDTEFFRSKEDSLDALEKLSNLGRDISVITKSFLPQDFIGKLREIDVKLKQRGNFLTLSESIPGLDSAKEWEPNVSSPQKRIDTLKMAYESGIKTLVAIRPLLPVISEEELRDIVNLTKNYCYGYYSGPLYLKRLNHPVLDKSKSEKLRIERLQPHWMPKDNIFYKIEKEGQIDLLKSILKENKKPLFEGAADAIKYLKHL